MVQIHRDVKSTVFAPFRFGLCRAGKLCQNPLKLIERSGYFAVVAAIVAAAPPGAGIDWLADWKRFTSLRAVHDGNLFVFEDPRLVRLGPSILDATEVLCKVLAHNICCVIQAQCELGIEAAFWDDEPAGDDEPDILKLPGIG